MFRLSRDVPLIFNFNNAGHIKLQMLMYIRNSEYLIIKSKYILIPKTMNNFSIMRIRAPGLSIRSIGLQARKALTSSSMLSPP